MENKKALIRFTLGLVTTAIVALILIVLVVKVVTLLVDESDLDKSKAQLARLNEIIEGVHKTGKVKEIEIFPVIGWMLTSNPVYGQCLGNQAKGCLCMCEDKKSDGECDKATATTCEEFEFEVEVVQTYYSYDDNEITEGRLVFNKGSSIVLLSVFKDGDAVKMWDSEGYDAQQENIATGSVGFWRNALKNE